MSTDSWLAVESFTQRSVLASAPTSADQAIERCRVVARLAAWCDSRHLPVSDRIVFAPDTIAKFFEAQNFPGPSTRTYRSIARIVAAANLPDAYPTRETSASRNAVTGPYSDAELDLLFQQASLFRSAKRRRHTGAVIALGAGAGVTGGIEIGCVQPSDVRFHRDIITVEVQRHRLDGTGVEYARTVPVRRRFQSLLATIVAECEAAGDTYLVGGQGQYRDRRTSEIVADFNARGDTVTLDVARLRTTWLVELLSSPVPLAVALDAIGITTLAPLDALLPHLPAGNAGDWAHIAGVPYVPDGSCDR
jgi:hypothetical protein